MLKSENIFEVFSMNDFYNATNSLRWELVPGQPVWYRGANNYSHNLIPSLYRENENMFNSNSTSSQFSLREDYRLQNFKSRVYHNISTNPSNKLEWQALYQHHWGKTRMLDWSESALTALTFALEPFIDPRDRLDLEYKRYHLDPCIWILSPTKLNENVYTFFVNNIEKMPQIFSDIFSPSELSDIANEIKILLNEKNSKSVYFSSNLEGMNTKDVSLDRIFSLCVIDDSIKNNLPRLSKMLRTGEFNPFFYLISRAYSDAFPTYINESEYADLELLPPLAILHPYQSERIRAQRGTFTIFPVYQESEKIKFYKNRNKDYRAMDINPNLSDCLYCIRLMDPENISREILLTGARHTQLYPDNEFFVHTLEAKTFHV